jgi:hypothetical protein
VVGDDLVGVFFGGLVVAKPGVASRRVKDPLGVVEDEVVLEKAVEKVVTGFRWRCQPVMATGSG